jgi:hypothetical protein
MGAVAVRGSERSAARREQVDPAVCCLVVCTRVNVRGRHHHMAAGLRAAVRRAVSDAVTTAAVAAAVAESAIIQPSVQVRSEPLSRLLLGVGHGPSVPAYRFEVPRWDVGC